MRDSSSLDLIRLVLHVKRQKVIITMFSSVQLFFDFEVSTRSTREKDHIPNFSMKYPSADAFPLQAEKPRRDGLDKAPSNYICHVLTF